MYAHVLTDNEEPEFRMFREVRLPRFAVQVGMKVVVRISAKGAQRWGGFGLEYGGFVVFDERHEELLLSTRFLRDGRGGRGHFPLNIGEDDMLFSSPIPASEEHWLPTATQRLKKESWMLVPPRPAIPAEPIGYVLDATHARQDIVRPADFQAHIIRSFAYH
jgi:hypothetical protein